MATFGAPRGWALSLVVSVTISMAFALILDRSKLAAATPESRGPKIVCAALVKARGDSTARIDCTAKNTGRDTFYLVPQPVSLEGPLTKAAPYIYYSVDWDRAENVLRFNRKPRWGTLFHRVVHIERRSLAHLVRLEPGSAMSLAVLWPIPLNGCCPSPGDWVSQLKLIYLDSSSRIYLTGDGILPAACAKDLLAGTSAAPFKKILELPAIRVAPVARVSRDRCEKLISAALKSAFSNTFVLRVRP